MARRISFIRDKIAPPRFLAFLVILGAVFVLAVKPFGWERALMTGFDVAGTFFVISVAPLLKPYKAEAMREHARENDANRVLLLIITLIVTAAIIVAIAAELGGSGRPNALLVVGTLAVAWLFSNTVFALHYAFLFYIQDGQGGLDFPKSDEPDYVDFVYFAFTLGMTFQTSDTAITARDVRATVTVHSLAAFVFNIGVLAFTINVLGG